MAADLRLSFAPLAQTLPANAVGRAVSATYVLSVHQSRLADPVDVAIPYDSSQIAPGSRVVLLRSDLEGPTGWVTDQRAAPHDGWMTTKADRSSLFRVVTITP